MQYVLIKNTTTGRYEGVCRKGMLDKIKADYYRGNLYEDCVEVEQIPEEYWGGRYSIAYLTLKTGLYRCFDIDNNGKMTIVKE